METLSEYLERIMRQKRLTPRDLEQRCGVSNSYISRLLNDYKKNIGLHTILALAKGLEVSPFEVFAVASGRSYELQNIDPLMVIEAMELFLLMPPEDQKSMLQMMRYLTEQRKARKELEESDK